MRTDVWKPYGAGGWMLRSALVVLILLTGASLVQACPTCKDSLTADPSTSNMVRGYFWSIVFMMSMPFLIFGGLGGYFYYEIRKARAQQAPGGSPSPPSPSVPRSTRPLGNAVWRVTERSHRP